MESAQLVIDIYPVDQKGNWTLQNEPFTQYTRIVLHPYEGLDKKSHLTFSVEANPPWWVRMLQTFGFSSLMILTGILLSFFHWRAIFRYRKKHPTTIPFGIIWTGWWFILLLQSLVIPYLLAGIYNLITVHGTIHMDMFISGYYFIISLFWSVIYIPLTYLYVYILRKKLKVESER